MTVQNDLGLVWAKDDPSNTIPVAPAKYEGDGWVAEIPSFQNFNYVLQNATGNILVKAEQGDYNWQNDIEYKKGAQVIEGTTKYFCIQAHTNQQPTLDTSNSYWVNGLIVSSVPTWTLAQSEGVKIEDVNVRTNPLEWGGTDITIQNSNALALYKTSNGATDNILLGNVNGELVTVNVGTQEVADSRSITPGNGSSRIFHEAHPPIQSEVAGTIPDSPNDGSIYGRRNSSWIKVTTTTVATEPPPPVLGNGQGWYNLEDGQTYVDIDDGNSSQWVHANPPALPEGPKLTTYDGRDWLIRKYENGVMEMDGSTSTTLGVNQTFAARTLAYPESETFINTPNTLATVTSLPSGRDMTIAVTNGTAAQSEVTLKWVPASTSGVAETVFASVRITGRWK